jgi:hypothetical protein
MSYTNTQKIAAIVRWQTSLPVHPLTCKMDSSILLPFETSDNPKQVQLKCPTCYYIQPHVPEVIYTCGDTKITYSDKNNINHKGR